MNENARKLSPEFERLRMLHDIQRDYVEWTEPLIQQLVEIENRAFHKMLAWPAGKFEKIENYSPLDAAKRAEILGKIDRLRERAEKRACELSDTHCNLTEKVSTERGD